MTLDPQKVQKLVERVNWRYPGWAGFDDPRLVEEERAYKLETRDMAFGPDGLLARERLERLIEDQAWATAITDFTTVGKHNSLMFQSVPSSADARVLYPGQVDDQAEMIRRMFDLLYGQGPSEERLERWFTWTAGQPAGANWPFGTFWLFMLDPDSEVFVKPRATRRVLKWLGSDVSLPTAPSGEAYAQVRGVFNELRDALSEYEPKDMVDIQSFVWVAGTAKQEGDDADAGAEGATGKVVLDPDKREEFLGLFDRFIKEYLPSPEGQYHAVNYGSMRERGRKNYEEIVAAANAGEDVTDRVLRQLLPHTESTAHRDGGYWVHLAPSVNGDVRPWFEANKWRESEDWPHVAKAILSFTRTCAESPAAMPTACEEFATGPWSKGFQQGMLSPILNALRPDDYLLFNNKSRLTLKWLTGTLYEQSLAAYPEANRVERLIISDLTADIESAAEDADTRPEDLFDMFCHWLVAVHGVPEATQHWKVAPGREAWNWETWQQEGYISVGWEAVGDLSGVAREDIDGLFAKAREQHPDYTPGGAVTLRRFAKDIKPGHRIVANKGKETVLGIGTVTGEYYFVDDVEHGHRIPVEWDDVRPRSIPTQNGWVQTLVSLSAEDFESIRQTAPQEPTEMAAPFNRVFANWDDAEWCFDLVRTTLEALDCAETDNPLLAMTYGYDGRRIRVNYGNWLVLDLTNEGAKKTIGMALLASEAADLESVAGTFKTPADEPAVVFDYFPR